MLTVNRVTATGVEMKVSELIDRLKIQSPDREVVLFVEGRQSQEHAIIGVGTMDPENGEPVKVVIEAFAQATT
jgi:hypothetical protein